MLLLLRLGLDETIVVVAAFPMNFPSNVQLLEANIEIKIPSFVPVTVPQRSHFTVHV